MAQERLSMRKTREILRLTWGLNMSKRQVARSLSVSHSTVIGCLRRAAQADLSWPLPEELDDAALESLLYPPSERPARPGRPQIPFKAIHKELRRKGVTLQLLWGEYKEEYPGGYQYSQFCHLYRQWAKRLDVVMRQEHKAGEKLFVDYAGQKVPITDPKTGQETEASVFVAVLGATDYSYAEACMRQDLRSWIGSHVRAFEFFGGVPEIIVPDNIKTGVKNPCLYEPDINPTYHEMALHYGTTIIPTRVARPKDKAKVEVGVLLVERWILAPLRNRTFFSLAELNTAIKERLEELNTREFQKLDTCRRDYYLELEKPALRPLPSRRYEYAEWKRSRVSIDYHIEIGRHYYSLPYQLVHKEVESRLTASTIEIFFKGRRVASHKRSQRVGAATTVHDHRPKSHQKYLEWTPSRIIEWAQRNGPHTATVVEEILARKAHPEQGYRSCLGIIRLAKKYPQRLEAACQRATIYQAFSYQSVKSILRSGLDLKPAPENERQVEPIEHKNIRGPQYFHGGGNGK